MNDANSMDGSFVSQKDLIPVINDDPKLRRAFVKQFEKLVWFAARKVYLKHRNLEFEDICMELWVVVFEKQCLLLRKFRGNSKFSTYFAVCLSHAAMDVARRISREAKGLPIVEQKSGGLMFDWLEGLEKQVVPENKPKRPDQLLEEKQVRKRVKMVVSGLPAKQRQFFVKAMLEDQPAETLAKEFELGSKNNVYKWRHRTMATIRERVQLTLER